jgi:hypothetical protein
VVVPDVIIVKKHYPKYRKRQKNRHWKLKHLAKEDGPDEGTKGAGGEEGEKKAKKHKKDRKWEHRDNEKKLDYEMFL